MKRFLPFLIAIVIVSSCNTDVNKPSVEMPDTKGIIHVGVVVKDLDASLRFYTEVLGMKEDRVFGVDSIFGAESGLSRGVPFEVKVLKHVGGDYATQWKLMSFPEAQGKELPANIQDDTGVQYITLFVDELKPYIVRIKENGVAMLGKTPIKASNGNHFVLVQDPDGTFVELIGPLGE